MTRRGPQSGRDRAAIAGLRPRRRVRGQWRILETRNGSDQATVQFVHGTQYIDEHVFMDVNGDPTNLDDCNPDNDAQGENDTDRRFYYLEDRNRNLAAISEYGGDGVACEEQPDPLQGTVSANCHCPPRENSG